MSKLWSPAIFETFKCAYNGLQTYNKACKEDGTILVQLISLVYIVFYGVWCKCLWFGSSYWWLYVLICLAKFGFLN